MDTYVAEQTGLEMSLSRRSVLALVAGSGMVVVSGCSAFGGSAVGEPSSADALLAAARLTAETTVFVNYRGGPSLKLDPAGRRGHFSYGAKRDGRRYQIAILSIDRELWVSESLVGIVPAKLMYISRDRVQAAGIRDFLPAEDPTGAVGLVKAASRVRREASEYRGVIDLSRAGHGAEWWFGDVDLSRYTGVPMIASVNVEGRLTSIRLGDEKPEQPSLEVVYAGFGRRLIDDLAKPPPGQYIDAPDAVVSKLASPSWRDGIGA